MSGLDSDTPDSLRAAEEAASWLLRLQEDAQDESAQLAFRNWLDADAQHRREYVVLQRLWSGLDSLDRRKRRRKTALLAGLAAVSLVVLASLQLALTTREHLETQVAEVRRQVLDDGTVAEIDAGSALEIDYSPWRRRVVVLRGQAQFKVAEGLRPFEVGAAGATIRDIGTTFNLRVRHDAGRVSVQEGIVDVQLDSGGATRRLAAGQQLDYSASADSLPMPRAGDSVPPWREGRWVFEATSLDEVVDEINRHHPRPVKLSDPHLGAYRVSGVFEQRDRQGLLRALVAILPLRLEEQVGETVIRPR